MKTTILRSILYAMLIFGSAAAMAQTTEIRGHITDAKTKEPLSFANVRLRGTITAATADADGYYYISTFERCDSLIVTYLGYPRRAIAIQRRVIVARVGAVLLFVAAFLDYEYSCH